MAPSSHDPLLRDLMRDCLRFNSVSGNEGPFTNFLAEWAKTQGFAVDLWQSTEAELQQYPQAAARHLPLAGRPTAVIRWPGRTQGSGAGKSLMFNAHTDVVAADDAERWAHPPFAGVEADGWFYGRGACDVKGPLVAAMGAMLAIRDEFPDGMAGDVMLELIPGEEDCVGLGTLTSVVRGYHPDGLIVLEPTENAPRFASRGGIRFEITARGRAVHGTVKWLGDDAIRRQRRVLDALDRMEQRWNDRNADKLFAIYPIARPITVDSIHGGRWQGMVCDECRCAGYLELLPADDPVEWQNRFSVALTEELAVSGLDSGMVSVAFSELYLGHLVNSTDSFVRAATETFGAVLTEPSGINGDQAGFNSGCEAGLRANLNGTPTIVWGPGSLDYAHAIDERIEWASVQLATRVFTDVARRWCISDHV